MFIDIRGDETGPLLKSLGGKGRNLAEVMKAGLRAPRTYALPAAAYHQHLQRNGISIDTEKLISLFHEDRQALARKINMLQQEIENSELNLSHLNSSADMNGLEELLDPGVIVRSSAVQEDGNSHSFAGCYKSYPGARSADELLKDIRRCWASSVSMSVVGYLARKKLVPVSGMSVLIQPLISTQKAGVCFSRDPKDGQDQMVIEAVSGMANGVVDGYQNVARYVLDQSGQLINPDGASNGLEHTLSPLEMSGVRSATLVLEKHLGVPVDMEWGWDGQQLYIFQVRPITTQTRIH